MTVEDYPTCFDIKEEALKSPLLQNLNQLAYEALGMSFTLLYPNGSKWEQSFLGSSSMAPYFCRLVQGTKVGEKKCKTCHTVMSVSTKGPEVQERICHTGGSILLAPVDFAEGTEDSLMVLSCCAQRNEQTNTDTTKIPSWVSSSGINPESYRSAFNTLPVLNKGKLEMARMYLQAVRDALQEIQQRMRLENEISQLDGNNSGQTKNGLVKLIEKEISSFRPPSSAKGSDKASAEKDDNADIPALIRVVVKMVKRSPGMPYSVAEIASAARMTPNHFSTLFRRHRGQSFSQFLRQEKIALAKDLLYDLSLDIQEIAAQVGYSDTGYFARCFKQETGTTPQKWRDTIAC